MSSNSIITRCYLFVLMCLIFIPANFAGDKKTTPDEKVEWGPPTQGFSASISTPKDTYIVGEPIPIIFRLKNDSTKSIFIMESDPFKVFDVEVTGTSFGVLSIEDFGRKGKRVPIPLTVYGKQKEFLSMEASARGGMLSPKKQFKSNFRGYSLSRLYDMSIAGEYEIKFSRRLNFEGSQKVFKVESNVLKIKITNPVE